MLFDTWYLSLAWLCQLYAKCQRRREGCNIYVLTIMTHHFKLRSVKRTPKRSREKIIALCTLKGTIFLLGWGKVGLILFLLSLPYFNIYSNVHAATISAAPPPPYHFPLRSPLYVFTSSQARSIVFGF